MSSAFAGDDSVNITGSFVSTTVQGGAGNDTIFIGGRHCSGAGSLLTLLSMQATELTASLLQGPWRHRVRR